MFKITVKTADEILSKIFYKEILLSDALSAMKIYQNKPCGGKGICQKCKIKATGALFPISQKREVLSCCTFAVGDVYIDYTSHNALIQGITDIYTTEYEKNPLINSGFGMAIDIGTTTIAAYIYKFPECECVKKCCVPNEQASFGTDVISRIEYANCVGLQKLKDIVILTIKKLCDDYIIEKYVITGNTTMLHLLCGLEPHDLAVAPFTPKSLFGEWHNNAYLPRCISANVGADITTAILASGMKKYQTSFLVDIGTNGEMALFHDNKIVCCSTAAGPAFEGAGISMGTLAISGAINKVYLENNVIKYETINNCKPIGICGTGIIDAVACMIDLNVIDETGFLQNDFQIGDSTVYINAKDIRQVQLAKSAIRSGIDALLDSCNISINDVEAFFIAGGFGSYINKISAAKIGLIPNEIVDKSIFIGNAAGSGASMILQSQNCLQESLNIACNAVTVELATNAVFMEKYIDNMMF